MSTETSSKEDMTNSTALSDNSAGSIAGSASDKVRVHPPAASSQKLGTWAVIGVIINRMVGSGIFSSPSTVIQGTNSTGVALLLWGAGAIVVLAGTHVMIEFGLSIPRHIIDGVEQAVPQNGGPVVFLQYLYPRPAYRERTVAMVTCVFGVTYVLLGSMAGNCLSFAIRSLEAAGLESSEHDSKVRGIAVAVVTFACLLNAFSFRASISLGHVFAVMKISILLLMVILGFCTLGGALQTKNFARENLSSSRSFAGISRDPLGYINAFLAIIFAWDGFDQPVWILEEFESPQRTVPRGTWIGVGLVTVLYMLVNLAYMVVVPKGVQSSTENVALEFFRLTLVRDDGAGNTEPPRVLQVFLALSALGNILVMPMVSARVKQEIARRGILPYASLIGANSILPFRLPFRRWDNSINTAERGTPVAAMVILWSGTVLSIVITIYLKPSSAYRVLVDLYAYSVPCFSGALLSFGMLKLRFSRKEGWRKKSEANPLTSVVSAMAFFVGCTFPLIAYWVPPKDGKGGNYGVPWYITPVVAVSVLSLGVVWFVCLRCYMLWRGSREGRDFRIKKLLYFEKEDDGNIERVGETVERTRMARESTAESTGV